MAFGDLGRSQEKETIVATRSSYVFGAFNVPELST
jgi:hypothetical protein